jgi:undecaprenyl pyrophosphate synthase
MESSKRPPGIHLGIIPDGNRRWLQNQSNPVDFDFISFWLSKLDILLETLWKQFREQNIFDFTDPVLRIQDFTIYFLTIDNLNRMDDTVSKIECILQSFLQKIQSIEFPQWFIHSIPISQCISFLEKIYNLPNIHIQIIGQLHLLPKSLQSILQSLLEKLCQFLESLRTHLLQSIESITDSYRDISLELFQEFIKMIHISVSSSMDSLQCYIQLDDLPERELSTITVGFAYDPIKDFIECSKTESSRIQPPIDLVIRTGGDHRTSGFFPFHTLYSEYIFHPKYFPDFSIEDLRECILSFQARERRFGK